MSRILSLLAAFLLALVCLPAGAEQSAIPLQTLGGTTWRSPEGIEFHFTGNARLFFSFDPEQPMYHFIGDGLYITTPAAHVGGPYVVLDSARLCAISFDSSALLVDDQHDDAAPLVFTYVDYPTLLAGTRWLDPEGTIFEFSADSMDFTCGCYGVLFSRTQCSFGAYYEMTIGTDREKWFDPSVPFAFLPDGNTLRVYGTRDDVPYLWQTFTRIAD